MEDMTPEEREQRLRRMPPVYSGGDGLVLIGVFLALFLFVVLK